MHTIVSEEVVILRRTTVATVDCQGVETSDIVCLMKLLVLWNIKNTEQLLVKFGTAASDMVAMSSKWYHPLLTRFMSSKMAQDLAATG